MIDLKNVTKNYGKTAAIDNITLNISDNGIYCLLGRNGAGKTTLMKLLAGYIDANGGEIIIDGKTVSPGHMPECVNFIESNSAQFNMRVKDLIGAASELQNDFDKDFALKMVKRFELNPDKRYKQLSFGMRTMLTTILTLSNNSKIILLDEPILGFDAIMRDQFNSLVLESCENHPRIIIISTHLIDEIAKISEHLIIIDNGKVLLKTDITDIDERAYTIAGTAEAVQSLIQKQNLNCIGKTSIGGMVAAHIYGDRIVPPAGVTLDRMSLQDFFINIVGGKKDE
ncbi:MAG: ABC transporter ATP-binding protein [Oscillospiraceae bacterium]|nr:ABC transporter ATP-binding protein [Oscillospiraceae bacterium]